MAHLVVKGKTRLVGEINIHGAKNAALPILCATALVNGSVLLHNVPQISDIAITLDILKYLGAKVHIKDKTSVLIDATGISVDTIPAKYVSAMRASFWFLGALVGRLGRVTVSEPWCSPNRHAP